MSERSPTNGHVRLRQAEPDDVDHQQRRNAAEDVDVDGRQEADRPAGRPRQQPHDGDHERPHQHDHFGDHEHLDVDPEALQQRPPRQTVGQRRPSEEDLGDSVVVRQQQPDEEGDDVHRQTDADRVPDPVARSLSLADAPIRSRLPSPGGRRAPNAPLPARRSGGTTRKRSPPCDRSAPDPPAAWRVGRVQPTRSKQAQEVGTSMNGTVDGSPPRYLAIRALIVPSSISPWMIGSKIAFLPLPLP